ncbi:MAG: NAD(P)-dependent oxidoreductase, partial [Phycisphaerae bacterium]
MRIIADEAIPGAAEGFAALGDVETLRAAEIAGDRVRDADVLLIRSVTRVGAALLQGSRVRFVGAASAGIDHVDAAWLADRGIALAHAPGSNATAVSEFVVAILLELADRRGVALAGRTLGVVGVGHCGARVARLAAALGMTVIRNDPPLAASTRDRRFGPIEELLAAADVVTLHVPLTSDGPCPTRRMVDARWLGRMRPGTWLINTARGDVADEAALAAAIETGRLGAVAL